MHVYHACLHSVFLCSILIITMWTHVYDVTQVVIGHEYEYMSSHFIESGKLQPKFWTTCLSWFMRFQTLADVALNLNEDM